MWQVLVISLKHFVKISIEGSFPSGVDELGTYQVTEEMHEAVREYLEDCAKLGAAKRDRKSTRLNSSH